MELFEISATNLSGYLGMNTYMKPDKFQIVNNKVRYINKKDKKKVPEDLKQYGNIGEEKIFTHHEQSQTIENIEEFDEHEPKNYKSTVGTFVRESTNFHIIERVLYFKCVNAYINLIGVVDGYEYDESGNPIKIIEVKHRRTDKFKIHTSELIQIAVYSYITSLDVLIIQTYEDKTDYKLYKYGFLMRYFESEIYPRIEKKLTN